MFIDIHCHLDDERLSDTSAVVSDFLSQKVSRAIFASCSDKSSEYGKNIAEKFEQIYFTAGFHPDEIERFNKENYYVYNSTDYNGINRNFISVSRYVYGCKNIN